MIRRENLPDSFSSLIFINFLSFRRHRLSAKPEEPRAQAAPAKGRNLRPALEPRAALRPGRPGWMHGLPAVGSGINQNNVQFHAPPAKLQMAEKYVDYILTLLMKASSGLNDRLALILS